jgi:hypothetical protein
MIGALDRKAGLQDLRDHRDQEAQSTNRATRDSAESRASAAVPGRGVEPLRSVRNRRV